MNRKQLIVIGALCVAAAFAGGIFGARLFAPGKAQAQGLPSYAEVITVGSLLIVDDGGNIKGMLGLNEDGYPFLILGDVESQYIEVSSGSTNAAVRVTDSKGNVRSSFGVFSDTPGIGFFDGRGNFIWGAP